MAKKIFTLSTVAAILAVAGATGAHVSVKPAQVGVGAFQNFSVGVPVELDMPTIAVRLAIPEGLEHVTPNVKPGWQISVKHGEPTEEQMTEAEDADHIRGPVEEIAWTGGAIPEGMRDEFVFSARVPAEETMIRWKAYQTYADGSVVSWELGPNDAQPKKADGSSDFSKFGPASSTKVVDDLKPRPITENVPVAFGLGAVGTILGVLALVTGESDDEVGAIIAKMKSMWY